MGSVVFLSNRSTASARRVERTKVVRLKSATALHRGAFVSGIVTISPAVLLAACVSSAVPNNYSAKLYSAEQSTASSRRAVDELSYTNSMCAQAGDSSFIMPTSSSESWRAKRRVPPMQYSSGDRFNIFIPDSPEFSGDYVINVDGSVILPYVGSIKAVGLTNAQLTKRIDAALARREMFFPGASRITVRPIQYAAINVSVSGAVFAPGRYSINHIKPSDKLATAVSKIGDNPLGRFLPEAVLSAGGVRPDADLSNIRVIRNGKTYKLNWRGAITGAPVNDLPLIEGDHIEVGEAGCFQSALVRPSQITRRGIRVFTSNLTAPALNNSSSAQNPNLAGGVPYGTRLLQGLVQANCVGGAYSTNARRYAVLISRNPKTRETEVIQRSIEDLVRSADRDTINPYLMPDDSIACYDSAVTEFRDVLSLLNSAIFPVHALKPL